MTSTYQGSRFYHGTAGCLLQDRSPVTAYLSHLSAWCVGVRGPAAVASTYKVWRITSSARVGGPALLLLRVSFRGTVSPTFVTTSAAWLTLSVTLVVLWIVSTTGRAPSPGIAPVAVPVSGILATLNCNASWASDICFFFVGKQRNFSTKRKIFKLSYRKTFYLGSVFTHLYQPSVF